jgi:hypothetical protein
MLISKFCLKSQNPVLFILGYSFSFRFSCLYLFLSNIRKIFINSIILKVSQFSNTEGFIFFDIKSVTKRLLFKSNAIFCINLIDSFWSRNLLSSFKHKIIWINTHGSDLSKIFNRLISTVSFTETEELHCNIEQRPQLLKVNSTKHTSSKPLLSLLIIIFNKFLTIDILNKDFLFINYLSELLNNDKKFQRLRNKTFTLDFFSKNF